MRNVKTLAAKFTHYENRDREPHLHQHVNLLNVVLCPDSKYRTLDSALIYKSSVELSEYHTNILMRLLHRELGVQWRCRENNQPSAAVIYEIEGISDELISQFSNRHQNIQEVMKK